jgi:hypothetical protein
VIEKIKDINYHIVMQPYTIEEYIDKGYLILYFPSNSSWLGSARIVVEELAMFLNVGNSPISLLIDITDSRPTIAYSIVSRAIRNYTRLSSHENLKNIMLITDDYVIKQAARGLVAEYPNLQIFRSRQLAINYLASESS